MALVAGPPGLLGPGQRTSVRPAGLRDQIQNTRVVRCDEAAWRFLGLSLAGYNVLISLALAAIALGARTARIAVARQRAT